MNPIAGQISCTIEQYPDFRDRIRCRFTPTASDSWQEVFRCRFSDYGELFGAELRDLNQSTATVDCFNADIKRTMEAIAWAARHANHVQDLRTRHAVHRRQPAGV